MTKEKYNMSKIIEIFLKAIDEAQQFNVFTSSEKLQKEQVNKLCDLVMLFKNFKQQAINQKDEKSANGLFKQQCMLSSLKSSLECWLLIKNSEFSKAWDVLIDAQEYCEVSMKIGKFEGLENLYNHLKSMEKSIFPSQAIYLSPGLFLATGNCSICNKKFTECNHLEDDIYMGRLCRHINREIIKFDHLAMVSAPHDRRAIVTRYSYQGLMIDKFTKEAISKTSDDDEMTLHDVRIMRIKELDLD
tara:strand:+ start:4457 stop:5191 length:735 start_codon:yes stop_codon:yes gene_type:complete